LSRIGRDGRGRIVVLGAHGPYVAEPELLGWRDAPRDLAVRWAACARAAPAELEAAARAAYAATMLPWERVLLDLHSGRIFGRFGPWVMDLAALLLVFLAATGPWLWWRQRRKRRARHPRRR